MVNHGSIMIENTGSDLQRVESTRQLVDATSDLQKRHLGAGHVGETQIEKRPKVVSERIIMDHLSLLLDS